jgi:hypothetical protein
MAEISKVLRGLIDDYKYYVVDPNVEVIKTGYVVTFKTGSDASRHAYLRSRVSSLNGPSLSEEEFGELENLSRSAHIVHIDGQVVDGQDRYGLDVHER